MKFINYLHVCWTISYTGLGKLGPKECVSLTLFLWLCVAVYLFVPHYLGHFLYFYTEYTLGVFAALFFITYGIVLWACNKEKIVGIYEKINTLTKTQKTNMVIQSIVLLLLPIAICMLKFFLTFHFD